MKNCMKNMIKSFPTLYKDNRMYSIWVEQSDQPSIYNVVRQYGVIDGKLQCETYCVTEGKNIGKINETTVEQQAILEAESLWKKQCNKNYSLNGNKKEIRPMLANKFLEHRNKVVYPCAIQPKLNGVRCIAIRENDSITFLSRTGKPYTTLDHLVEHLMKIMTPGEMFDGEIYNHDMSFEDIVSAVKRKQDLTQELEYWVYDVISDETFVERFVNKPRELFNYKVRKVATPLIQREDQIFLAHKSNNSNGFEGTMIRNLNSKYVMDKRSNDLLKLKDFIDAEFEIVGFEPCIIAGNPACTFICKIGDKRFECLPSGNSDVREKYLCNADSYIGKMLTVRYQNLSKNGIPIFPVGITVRDYE